MALLREAPLRKWLPIKLSLEDLIRCRWLSPFYSNHRPVCPCHFLEKSPAIKHSFGGGAGSRPGCRAKVMSLYFLVLDAAHLHDQVVPALGASWRRRSFEPLRPLAESLKPSVEAFAGRFFTGQDESLLLRAGRDLPFDREVWRLLAGEILLYSARDIPEIETAPQTLCWLL